MVSESDRARVWDSMLDLEHLSRYYLALSRRWSSIQADASWRHSSVLRIHCGYVGG